LIVGGPHELLLKCKHIRTFPSTVLSSSNCLQFDCLFTGKKKRKERKKLLSVALDNNCCCCLAEALFFFFFFFFLGLRLQVLFLYRQQFFVCFFTAYFLFVFHIKKLE